MAITPHRDSGHKQKAEGRRQRVTVPGTQERREIENCKMKIANLQFSFLNFQFLAAAFRLLPSAFRLPPADY